MPSTATDSGAGISEPAAAPISPADLRRQHRMDDIAAARLVSRIRLAPHERNDLRQDPLLDLIVRLSAFDPITEAAP